MYISTSSHSVAIEDALYEGLDCECADDEGLALLLVPMGLLMIRRMESYSS